MELSQEEKDRLYELIDKINPCVAIDSKDAIERFKILTEWQMKTFEIPSNENLLYDDKIYLVPIESNNKPIKLIMTTSVQ